MHENIENITKKDVLKHYLSSIIVYGIILLLVSISPLFNQTIENPYFNYITVLSVYYLFYIFFAYPVLLKLKPQTLKNSRNYTIIKYFKRQFTKNNTMENVNKLTPDENEKQAFVILFLKAYFSVIGLNLLCNRYLPSLGYDFEFLRTMFEQSIQYSQIGGFWSGCAQFIEDTQDMWLTLMFTITTLIYTLSYLTETKFLGNKIKYADTTFLGITSCILCYYPLIMLTNRLLPMNVQDIMPIGNFYIRTFLYVAILIVNFILLLSVLRLGLKSGNLTNRGIVTSFPYNIIRHPDYAMQMLYIVLTSIPVYLMSEVSLTAKILGTLGIILWLVIYNIRAITEERNLLKDNAYVQYCENVKYRFIPKIW